MNISEIHKELQETREEATRDISNAPFATRTGLQGRKNAAINKVAVLEEQLRRAVIENSVAVFLYGDKEAQQEFAAVAEDEGKAITVSAYALFERLAKPIEENLKITKTLNVNHAVMFNNELSKVLHELQATFSGPGIGFGSILSGTDDVKNLPKLLKGLFDRSGLTELNTLYVQREVANRALKDDYDQNVVPVIVTGAYDDDKETPKKLFNRGSANIGIEVKQGEINNQVTKVFKRLETAFKKIKVNNKE